jgi:hypothetical protein
MFSFNLLSGLTNFDFFQYCFDGPNTYFINTKHCIQQHSQTNKIKFSLSEIFFLLKGSVSLVFGIGISRVEWKTIISIFCFFSFFV